MTVNEPVVFSAAPSTPALLGGTAAVRRPFPDWPRHGEEERQRLLSTLDSGEWWSLGGTQVRALEAAFAQRHGVGHALATTNGTHAIELALRTLDIGPGDEVIVPALTFVATAMPVFSVGARPVPVDVDLGTWCLDVEAAAEAIGPRTRLMVPVHFAGQPVDLDGLGTLSETVGVPVLEDAAHAHGAAWRGRPAGSFGLMAAYSFQNYKLMTAGEGGMLLFTEAEMHRRAVLRANCGRPPGDTSYRHDELGSNFRLSEFQGAVLRAQLARLDDDNERREARAAFLDRRLAEELPELRLQVRHPGVTTHSHYMYVFSLREGALAGLDRDTLVRALVAEGLPAYRAYPCIQDTGHFAPAMEAVGAGDRSLPDCTAGRRLADTGVWLHHRVLLGDEEHAEQVVEALCKVRDHAPRLRREEAATA